jgi:MFS family permease
MRRPSFLRGPLAIGIIALVPLAVLFLLGGHFAHVAEILLWLVVIMSAVAYGRLRRGDSGRQDQGEHRPATEDGAMGAIVRERLAEPPEKKTSLLGPLKNPVFRTLWLASLVSGSAVSAQDTALRWVMNGLSASSLLLSAISTLTFLAFCLLTFPAGMVADRIDRRRILEISNVLLASAGGLLTLFALLRLITPLVILIFAFILACGMAMTAPAWTALMPEVVEEEFWPAVSALGGVQLNLSSIVGPAIGGFLIPTLGTSVVFGLAAASFLLLAWSVRSKRLRALHLPAEKQKTWTAMVRELVKLVASHRRIQIVIARNVLFSLFISVIPTLLPVVGLKVLQLNSTSLGLLFTSLGIGAVLGGLWIVPIVKARLSANGVTVLASIVLGLTYFLMGCVRQPPVFMLVAGIGGVAWTLAAAELWAAGLSATSPGLRGRVNAMLMVVANAGLVAGGLLWGMMPDRIGVDATLHTASVALVGSLPLLFWLSIDLDRLDASA